ncbi:MAG: endonuclease/exonuclease/phosphatase family protein [Bacteroidota bacterium]
MKEMLLVLLFCLIVLPVGVQAQSSERPILKVLSFNILGGRTTAGDFNIDAVAKVIQDLEPDLVALQEVDYKVNRSHKVDLATELGYRTKMAALFGRAMYYDGGEYGEGILSRYSFVASRNVPLPFLEGQEPRAALEVTVALPSGDTISFVGTHLSHEGPEGREMQADEINRVFAANQYPTILAGDLNARPGTKTINSLEDMWTSTYDRDDPQPTIPSNHPKAKIDYIMYKPASSWRVIDRKAVCDSYASDHCAYLVTLELSI